MVALTSYYKQPIILLEARPDRGPFGVAGEDFASFFVRRSRLPRTVRILHEYNSENLFHAT